MRNYEEVAERVFRRGNEIIKRNKRRRRVILGVCSSAACLAVVIAVSFGEWASSRRGFNAAGDIDLNWRPDAPEASASAYAALSAGQDDPEITENNTLTDFTGIETTGEPTDNAFNQPIETRGMIWPVGGEGGVIVEKMYSDGGYVGHKGIDISAPYGTPVYAAADGTVIEANGDGYNGGRGLYVAIEHDDGYVTNYCHLSDVCVAPGQRVTAGDTVGEVGATGKITGESLHFEVRGADGTPLNPLDFLPEHESAIAERIDEQPHTTTVIDDFDIGGVACYSTPENGNVIHSEPLKEAMKYYGEIDKYGGDIFYYIKVDFFKDGEFVDPGDPVIREEEWSRISETGVQCEMMTTSANWGELNTYYFLLMLTKKEIENFAPSDGLGYIFCLVDEDGKGPVRIERDTVHLPETCEIATETGD